jgi:RsiW-degrading membrane proteinase PrsW (M82 family)
MNILFVNTLIAAVPAIVILIYFYRKDTFRPEPKKLVFISFVYGIIIILPAAVLELLLIPITSGMPQFSYALITGFGIAALVEEGLKYLIVVKWVVPRPEFDEITDGIVYTVAASMGFALFENILYSLNAPVSTALLRGVTAVPLHAAASGIMGYYLGAAKFNSAESSKKGLLFAVLIHGAYNFLLMTETLLGLLIVPVLLFSWKHLGKLYRKAQTEDRYFGRS